MSTEQKDYTEKIVIKNFGGIKDLEMPINKINVLIGPQAAGKSMVAKLLFYFKDFFYELVDDLINRLSKREINDKYMARFKEYFPTTAWPKNHFEIHYFKGNVKLSIYRKKIRSIKFEYSENFHEWLKEVRKEITNFPSEAYEIIVYEDPITNGGFEKQIFMPAGRNFFADLQANIFSFLSNKQHIDPFLIEFGKIYQQIKGNGKLNNETILKAEYKREYNKDFLVHKDGRKVNLSYASSGQQEVLPLLVILDAFSNNGLDNRVSLYIEEPEAHLFPNAQKEIVELLAKVVNSSNNNIQIVVTTHSPYILSAFNNLLYAGQIEKNNVENEKKLTALYKTVEKESIVKPNTLNAFAMVKGEKINIIDEETQLIGDNVLDEISNVIANQFDKLLDLDE
ncbi:MAG: AAA family ATPase [Chitinophagales bacterium]